MCSYYFVRQLLAALTLFSVAFFLLALAGLGGLLIWSACVQLVIWAKPASRNVIPAFPPLDRSLRAAVSEDQASLKQSFRAAGQVLNSGD
jgi:hypothetical protein